jgi:hypothetical protein
MSHACGAYSVETFLKGKTPAERELFDAFVDFTRLCGPITLAPAKTRVAIMVRTRFCAINALSSAGLRFHLVLPYRLEHPRIRKIEVFGALVVHHLVVQRVDELDDELREWVCASYHLMGRQERLKP